MRARGVSFVQSAAPPYFGVLRPRHARPLPHTCLLERRVYSEMAGMCTAVNAHTASASKGISKTGTAFAYHWLEK